MATDHHVNQLVEKVGRYRRAGITGGGVVEAFLKVEEPADVMGQIDGDIGAIGSMAGIAGGPSPCL